MGVLIAHPWLAVLAGTALLALWWRSCSRWAAAAAAAWIAYAGWELFVTEGPDANIRIDLLLIYPVLAVLSVIAIGAALRRHTKR
ncbi:hypothetical protein [Mycobacterium sp. C31M]